MGHWIYQILLNWKYDNKKKNFSGSIKYNAQHR